MENAFNSTMVRLKEGRYLNFMMLSEFQFHYGTIKRTRELEVKKDKPISIPLWYD